MFAQQNVHLFSDPILLEFQKENSTRFVFNPTIYECNMAIQLVVWTAFVVLLYWFAGHFSTDHVIHTDI